MGTVLIKIGILLGLMMLNIFGGYIQSVKLQDYQFDKHKFITGIIKGGYIGITLIFLYFVFLEMPELTSSVGISPIALIYLGIVTYVIRVIIHLMNIGRFKIANKEKEELRELISEEDEENEQDYDLSGTL